VNWRVKAKWKLVQRHLNILVDGDPGNQTVEAVARALGIGLVPDSDGRDPGKLREPVWLQKARGFEGLREIKGARHHKQILTWWEKIKAPFRDDETPWCAGFVGGILEEESIQSSRSAAARSYMNWGKDARGPKQGAIVVFWRGKRSGWSGHVGFVVGVAANGDPWVLGGNQGDAVSIRKFSKDRVLGYRWPRFSGGDPKDYPAAILNHHGQYSTNEA